jgi:hypothetical protein
MSSSLASLVSLFVLQSLAQSPSSWNLIDSKVYQAALCDAYIDGATYQFRRKSCSVFGCDEWDYAVKTHCGKTPTGALSATIEHRRKNGSVFARETMTEADWRQLNGNLLRAKEKFVTSLGHTFSLDQAVVLSSGLLSASYSIRSGTRIIETGSWIFGSGPSIPQVQERSSKKVMGIQEETSDILIP